MKKGVSLRYGNLFETFLFHTVEGGGKVWPLTSLTLFWWLPWTGEHKGFDISPVLHVRVLLFLPFSDNENLLFEVIVTVIYQESIFSALITWGKTELTSPRGLLLMLGSGWRSETPDTDPALVSLCLHTSVIVTTVQWSDIRVLSRNMDKV